MPVGTTTASSAITIARIGRLAAVVTPRRALSATRLGAARTATCEMHGAGERLVTALNRRLRKGW